ncbi:MAG: hypothetical protein VYD64_09050, partial [Pseudomonadota bacterium]|nr:hypothetical protein [Pseudomonadota bacterium]
MPDLITGKAGGLHSALALPSGKLQRFVSVRVALDLYCLLEMIVVFLCGLAAAEIYVERVLGFEAYVSLYAWPLLMLPITMALIMQRAGLYSVASLTRFVTHSGKAVAGLCGAFLTIALVGVILGTTDAYSRVWYGSWLVASIVAMWLLRALAVRVFSRWADAGV